MKTKLFLLLAIFTSIFAACNQNSTQENTASDSVAVTEVTNPNLKLQIIYFHATHRCPTCNSIEANINQVLEETFQAEVNEGIITFDVLNVEEEANKALAEKFQATGAALHLVKIADGKQIDKNFTEFAFANSRQEPDLFVQTLRDSIASYIFN